MTAAGERPDDRAIRQSLDAILASDAFARSERLRAFLGYVVEKEITGCGHQLKGYTIGIDVFDRPQAFNADSDPLVRVHAGKLRKLLAAYYAGQGIGDEWRIDIPKGSYIPCYRRKPLPASARASAQQSAQPRTSATPRRAAGGRLSWLPAPLSSPVAVLTVLPLLIFIPVALPVIDVDIPARSRLHEAMQASKPGHDLPKIRLRTQSQPDATASRFSDALRNAAAHYRTIEMPRDTGRQAQPDPLAFTIAVTQQDAPAGLRVTISNDASADTLFDGFIAGERLADDADILFESLALAARAFPATGEIFRHSGIAGIDSPLMKCMVATDAYRHLQTREAFQGARSCQANLSGDDRQWLKFAISASALPETLHQTLHR